MQEKFDTDVNPVDYFINKTNDRWNYRSYDRKKRSSMSFYSLIFNQPQMIGYFSVNEYREFVPDASQLRYLKMPQSQNVRLDLNDGLKEFRPKPESVKREKMDFLLRFIVNNLNRLRVNEGFGFQGRLLSPDIICSRGRLVQIMCPQYTTDKKWSLIVSKYKGNVYICQPDGDDFHTIQTAYGFKFEQYLLSENPLDDPVTDVPVIESEEFYGVFESGIGNISLLYNAEMDGLDSSTAVDLTEADFNRLKFVELKTCLGPSESRHCRWWAHTFLAGISEVTVGYRTREGIVTRVENLPIDFLKSQAEANWSPAKCIELLKTFLNFVLWICRNVDSPHTVYKFDYDCKLNKTIQCTIFRGKNEYSFLPDWYLNETSA
ncbi:decapping nuclease DXO homolog [Bradysia coprophila]|uniref:decapping nuclease DXO homolog n=1 Tax=Bradysia coprophila TaxID=38358 RepID=UPI00187D9663|nr:decapping nuclease DXO homolog [Bradysia coprophila]